MTARGDTQQQLQELLDEAHRLMESQEAGRVRQRPTAGFPFNLLVQPVVWALTVLTLWVGQWVARGLMRLYRPRKR